VETLPRGYEETEKVTWRVATEYQRVESTVVESGKSSRVLGRQSAGIEHGIELSLHLQKAPCVV
jgi:hypothetical protein